MTPSLSPLPSVNQRFPSGPATIPLGSLDAVGVVNSVMTGGHADETEGKLRVTRAPPESELASAVECIWRVTLTGGLETTVAGTALLSQVGGEAGGPPSLHVLPYAVAVNVSTPSGRASSKKFVLVSGVTSKVRVTVELPTT
jgi:hypothetical protein